ncbi:MAG: amidohydrolase family protein [Pseudomonadota bacterium]
MKLKKTALALASALAMGALAIGCGSGDDALVVDQGVVIKNATIVNTADGSLTTGRTIVLADGKIRTITGTAVTVAGSAQLVDASGQFVVPGYLDMHTHAMFAAEQSPAYWPLLIANGITGIREMSGSADIIKKARQLNLDSAAHKVDAPEILAIPSDIFTGQQAGSAEAAAAFVDQKLADGADFIKVVGGNREAVLSILKQAKAKGSYVAGHLVTAVSAQELTAAGWHAVEHLGASTGFLLDCSSQAAALRAGMLSQPSATSIVLTPQFLLNPLAFIGAAQAPLFQKIIDTYDPEKCGALAASFVAADTWHIPTMIRLRTQHFGNDTRYQNNSNLIYVDKTRRALWQQTGATFAAQGPAVSATLESFYGFEQKAVKMLDTAGVSMLTGSDLGGGWVVPGFALHDEFHELAEAGLSPLRILQMTTLNGAKFLRREASMGSVAEGKNADLVILRGNPIADVNNLDNIATVVLKGKVFNAGDLQKMKDDVAAAYASMPAPPASAALDMSHRH